MYQSELEDLTKEHDIILGVINRLAEICPEQERTRMQCAGCSECETRRCDDEACSLLEEMLNYAVSHFRNEERLMKETGLHVTDRNAFEAHVQDHGDISATLSAIIGNLPGQGPAANVSAIATLARQWLNDHISGHDAVLLAHILGRK